MNPQTATSPVSTQHCRTMPLSTSTKGIPKASSITRNWESFISGRLDLGVLDVSTDCGAGEKLDDGTRCIRFAAAAMALESLFSPTPANKAESAVPQHVLPQQAVQQMAAVQKRVAPPLEAVRKNESQEVLSSASKDDESVTSLRVKSLIDLFDNESVASSDVGIRDSATVINERPTRPVMETMAMLDDKSKPSVNCVETNLQKRSPEHGSKKFDQHVPVQCFPSIEYADTELVSVTEIEKVDSRTNRNNTLLNTQEIDDAVESIDIDRTKTQKRGRLGPLTGPITAVKNMFTALKKLGRRRAKKDNSSESPQNGCTNEADSGPTWGDPLRMGSDEESKSPNIPRKKATTMLFSPGKAKEARTQRHATAHSRDSSLQLDVDSARKRRGNLFKSLDPFKYF